MKSLRGAAAVCGSCRPCPLSYARAAASESGTGWRSGVVWGVCFVCMASGLLSCCIFEAHIQGRTLHHGRRLEDTGAAADRAGAGNACGRPVGAAPEPRKRAFQNPPARPAGWWSVFLPAWQRIALQADAVLLYRWRALRGMACYFSLSVPSFWAVGFGAVLRLGRRDRRGGVGFGISSGIVTS